MWFKIYWVKFMSFLGTLLGSVVYNFHKHIKGVKTKKNFKYKEKGNAYNKLDIFYPEDADCIYNKKKIDKKTYPCIVYFHGGGWACYSKILYTTLCRRLAKMGFVVFNCNYRLAPQVKLQEILEDCVCAFDYVSGVASNFGGDAERIIMAGDSAGAHISAELEAKFISERETSDRYNKVNALGLFYGVYDLVSVCESKFPNINAYMNACVHGGMANTEELLKFSPIYKDIEKFAPCFLASGEIDKLHQGQSKRMAEALKEKGVTVKTKFFKLDEARAMHAFMTFDGLSTNVDTLCAFDKFLHDDLKLKGE